MIASFPMYDRPETRAAYDRLWADIRSALGFGPTRLNRSDDLSVIWSSPRLLLSQTCSLPYRLALHRHVDIVASPVYELPCEAGHYFSVLVVRENDRRELRDFRNAPLAINSWDSQSGWAAVCDLTQSVRHVTGSHRASAMAVADGLVDIAAIDAVTWTMVRRWDGFAQHLRDLGTTTPTPALPFVTHKGNDTERLFDALASALGNLSPEDRDTLCLKGVTKICKDTYRAIPVPAKACQMPENP